MKAVLFNILFFFSTALFAQTFEKKTIDIDSEIQGDLYIGSPSSKTVLILIAGSGPTDRNGNTPTMALVNNSLKLLAEGLAVKNQNVFTFDKRIISQMRNNNLPEKVVFEDLVNDVVLIMSKLQTQFPNTIIVGHSEGSLIGILAAQQKTATAFVSLAGPAQSIDKILTKQVAENAPFLKGKMDEIFSQLREGQIVTDVIPMLQSIFITKNQPYLMSWMKYDPARELSKLEIPILIVNGTKDIQIDENEAKILNQKKPKSTLVLIEGMNHIFKNIEKHEDNVKSYTNPSMPLHPNLVPTIISFLNTIK